MFTALDSRPGQDGVDQIRVGLGRLSPKDVDHVISVTLGLAGTVAESDGAIVGNPENRDSGQPLNSR
jgi:hypothetical protein